MYCANKGIGHKRLPGSDRVALKNGKDVAVMVAAKKFGCDQFLVSKTLQKRSYRNKM